MGILFYIGMFVGILGIGDILLDAINKRQCLDSLNFFPYMIPGSVIVWYLIKWFKKHDTGGIR